jgi:hypothetical protein
MIEDNDLRYHGTDPAKLRYEIALRDLRISTLEAANKQLKALVDNLEKKLNANTERTSRTKAA